MSLNPKEFGFFLAGRQSIRNFTLEPVPRAVVEELIIAACQAPSAHNAQPWRFVVLLDMQIKRQLAQAMGDKLRADRIVAGDAPSDIDLDVKRSYERISSAPASIVVCLSMQDMHHYPDERRSRIEFQMGIQSVAMASQNLLLAAYAEGLGACWLCAPFFAQKEVSKVLYLPSDWEPQGMIILGHPTDGGRERERKAVDEVTEWR